MRSRRPGTISTSLTAVLIALLMTWSLAWGIELPDETPLTPAQEDSIREEMGALAQVLVGGGKTPREARLAVNAVGICLGAAYGHGLTRQQADSVCGLVLDAFTIQQGTTLYVLTAEDHGWVATRVVGWTDELSAILDPDELEAVQSTMQACLEGQMRRGESREDAVKRCAMGLLPLLNRPELRQRLLEAAGRLP